MPIRPALLLSSTSAVIVAVALTGCTKEVTANANPITVDASDSACTLNRTDLTAGANTFNIKNTGTKTTELYVYTADQKIVSERENITPGSEAALTVELKPGTYEVACKPGGTGTGLRQKVIVSSTGAATAAADPKKTQAVTEYRSFVQTQVDTGLPLVQEFAAAVKTGDLVKAAALYPRSRQNWERIEPVAESFGDLDPKLDLREADLEPSQEWTGWHRLEKAIFTKKSVAGEAKYADLLVTDYLSLQKKIPTAEITATSMANGAKELLDEVATGKITGEENIWSGTDLWDFAANIEGARKVYDLLTPIVAANDPSLKTVLDSAFKNLDEKLTTYRTGSVYVDYRKVTPTERKALADLVNALAEPLSKLAITTTK